MFFLLPVILLALSIKASAQSAISKVIVFDFTEEEIFMPPELYIDVDFEDSNDNKILEAQESGVLRLNITNKGGDANDVIVSISPSRNYKGVNFEKARISTSIKSNETKEMVFPISATINVPTDSAAFNIHITESYGYDLDASLVLSTYEYLKPKIQMQGVTIIDAGKGLRAMNDNPDGKLQKGEVVRAVVTLQNTGVGVAHNVNYKITSLDQNVLLMTETSRTNNISGKIDEFMPGEVKEVSFRLSANNNYKSSANYLPVYIEVTENSNFGNLASTNIPIPLGRSPEKLKTVDIKGDNDKLLATQQQLKVYSSSNRFTSSNNSKIRDISVAPYGEALYKNGVAIVIGVEKNSYGVAPAPYAARDAKVMANYFKNSLGIEDIHVLTDNEVTKSALSDLFDSRYGYLSRTVQPGQTDVFVFYSGHGIPDVSDKGDQDVYLFPWDARKEMVKERGYSLNKLYADLNSLNARSVTVILDACFSGSSRMTVTHESENLSNEKGVRFSMPSLTNKPWENNPNFRVFTSSADDQTSLGYDQSQSGLFTYYLATGLQGDADTDKDGVIQFNELVDFVSSSVSAESKKIRGGAQDPQFYGNGNFIITKTK